MSRSKRNSIARIRFAVIACLIAPAALPAQSSDHVRPKIYADADTNDAQVYYAYGLQALENKPEESVKAFYWASRIDPSSADALYALHAATLMSMSTADLGKFVDRSQKKRPPQYLAIDSMLYRAYTINPFLPRRMERQLQMRILEAEIVNENPSVDRTRLNEYILARSRATRNFGAMAAADGRVAAALESYAKTLTYKGWTKKERAHIAGDIHAERAQLFYRLGNLDSARSEMTTAVAEWRERDVKETVVLYQSKAMYEQLLGMIYERASDGDKARESYEQAVQEDLSFYAAHRRLAELSMAKGDTANGLLEMDLAIQLQPEDPVLRFGYAKMLVTAHRDGDAAAQLTKAIAADPYYAPPHMLLARIADLEQYTDDAVREYQAYVALTTRSDPQRSVAQARLSALKSTIASSEVK